MSSSAEVELMKIHKVAQEKHIYFILAAAGSGIGFSLVQSKVEKFSYHHLIWIFAIALWAISFLCGLRSIEYINNGTVHNAKYLAYKRNLRSAEPRENEEYEFDLLEKIIVYDKGIGFYVKAQSYFLFGGAIVYIAWHVYRMSFYFNGILKWVCA